MGREYGYQHPPHGLPALFIGENRCSSLEHQGWSGHYPPPPVISACLWGGAWTSSRLRSAPDFEQADTVIGGTDQVVLGTFQLQVVHVELLVHLAAMEEKLVGGDGKQGGRVSSRTPWISEILQVFATPGSGRNCACAPA